MTKPPRIADAPSQLRRILARTRRTANIWVGTLILLVIITLAVFAPVITPYNPIIITPALRLKPPDSQHLFGTDDFGRDIFTRVLYGAQLSLQVGLISVTLASITGTILGIVAGYNGGWIDALIMRIIDVMLAFPSILLALAIVATLGLGSSRRYPLG